MNGIIIAAIVILTIGLIGISFGMLHLHREQDHIHAEIDAQEKAIKCEWKETEILRADLEDLVTFANDMKSGMNQIKMDTRKDIALLSEKIYGTADIAEFHRVKTAAYAADMRSQNLEKIIQAMNGRNITPRPRRSIQKGMMTVAVADDEKATDAEVRASDG